MRESEASGRPLGHTLVDLGYLTDEDLSAAVALQVERIVLSVLRWTSGALRREPMDRPLPADLGLELNTHRLLLLGTRQFPDAARLWRSLGPPDRRLRRVLPGLRLRGAAAFAGRARGARPVHAVRLPRGLLALPLPRPELLRAVYALLAGGLVDDAPARVAPAPLAPAPPSASEAASPHPPAEMDPLLTPAPPPPQTPEDAERAARGLLRRASVGGRSRSCRLPPTATRTRVDRAGCSR